jgi:hypothetical protein
MQHALLLNPFNLGQESSQPSTQPSSQPSRPVNRPASRSTPVCSSCQSDDIICHAPVQWSNESQQWELASTFDQPTHCNRCDGACSIIWMPLN